LVIAFLAAASSGAVIILHALHWITLTYSIWLLAPLSAIVFVMLLVRSERGQEEVFVNRLRGGAIAGALAVAAYDMVRLLLLLSGLFPFNPFRPIEVYGLLILDRYQDTPLTKAVGWTFHVWNGLAFAIMYTLAVGRGRVLWGLGWGMMLEVAMIATYPSIFRLRLDWAFVLVSLIGHVAYGLTIGITARKVVRW
jgi:hypothetical protein